MNGLNVFNNEKFGTVRTVLIDEVVWFVGKDVVECLGYDLKTNSYTLFIQRHCDEEDYLLIDSKTQLQNVIEFDYKQLGQRGGYLINQYGVIDLVMGSPLPQAREFKRWVTHEVVPAVLTTGSYTMTRQFTPLETAIGTIVKGNATPEELGEAIYTLSNIFRQKGKAELCQEGMVNVSQIIDKIKEMYPDRFDYTTNIVSIEWTRFMKHLGYVRYQTFPRKNGCGYEKQPTPQPTQKFFDELEEHGMATARVLPDDRGKREIRYTKEIFKLLEDEVFIDLFFNYLDMIYTKKEDTM